MDEKLLNEIERQSEYASSRLVYVSRTHYDALLEAARETSRLREVARLMANQLQHFCPDAESLRRYNALKEPKA